MICVPDVCVLVCKRVLERSRALQPQEYTLNRTDRQVDSLTHIQQQVAGVLTNANQPRGVYIGASPVPDKCMGNDTLIFLGTGTRFVYTDIRTDYTVMKHLSLCVSLTGAEHTQIREFLLSNIPAWRQTDPGQIMYVCFVFMYV
jgi:hypothetical protein